MAAGDKVLLTGITGFIARHIADNLIKKGYTVVGTLRNANSRTHDFRQLYPEAIENGQLQFFEIADIAAPAAFHGVFNVHTNIKYVIHTASPTTFNGTDFKNDIVDPAVNGTLSVLTAAHAASGVERFVFTSSLAACVNYTSKGIEVNEDTWNPVTYEESLDNGIGAYYGSKALAERAVYEFVDKKKPSFEVVTIVAPSVLGGPVNEINKIANVHPGLDIWFSLIDAKDMTDFKMPMVHSTVYVDIRDLADIHVLAIDKPDQITGNSRYLASAGFLSSQLIVDGARKTLPPNYADRIYKGTPGDRQNGASYMLDKIDASKSNSVFQLKFRTIEDTAGTLMKYLIDVKDKDQL